MDLSTDTLIINLNKLKLQIQATGLEPLNVDEEQLVKNRFEMNTSIEEVIEELRKNREASASVNDGLTE
ncbi:MAG: hypothetical protein ACAH12_03245 [Methylophilaceae bacterium]|uniref:hypothetical protein n=1 Tax=Methylovorus sp. MM2 TaxID=1848038 RepID=UPI0007E08D3E|nr:hypothetical protein [Methylovorus sp. MM2]OAM51506.1 hypothetical protein A7981_08425 [Methylovorus sp. MM2]